MKRKVLSGIALGLVICFFSIENVYANSSWVWLTEHEPYELLPVAIFFTVLIETLILALTLKIRNIGKVCGIVVLGNILSFLVPYLTIYLILRAEMGYETFERAFSVGPYYIIGLGYLFLTIVIELPVVYYGLRKEIKNKRFGCAVICIANCITTIMVFVIERIFCYGQW